MDRLDKVSTYYDTVAGVEWDRLERDAYHSLEFIVTMHYLRKYLPSQGTILDAGGGPGRYAIELCRLGYEVVLLDASPGLIEMAGEKFAQELLEVRERLTERVVGDICDLSRFPDERFDAVVSLGGPITHISDRNDQERAVQEMARVTRPGGLVFISAVGYLACLQALLTKFPHEIADVEFRAFRKHHNHRSRGMDWHFFTADELRVLAESCGLTTLDMAGLEGLSSPLPEATNALHENEAAWQAWLEAVLETASDPAVADTSGHILYIGRVTPSDSA